MVKKQSGVRFQVLVLKIKRNTNSLIRPLLQLTNYFKTRGEEYELICSSYGSPKKAMIKTWSYLIRNNYFDKPVNALYRLNKESIDSGKVSSLAVSDMGLIRDFEKLNEIILEKIFKKKPKRV